MMRSVFAALAVLMAAATPALAQEAPRNVVLVTIDGYRWEELFRGADPNLVHDERYRERFVDVPNRAEALTPFLLSFGQEGALIGDRDHGSCARVSNEFWFSYPGYAEMMAGRPNPRVRYNAAVPNDDVTVLERLLQRPEFAGQVRVFAEWETMAAILNVERSGIPLYTAPASEPVHDPYVRDAAHEVFGALPRVTWIALGDTDNRAHEGEYEQYLAAAAEADLFLRQLWEAIEADPRTAGHTTLIVTADHGRGGAEDDQWTGHGSGRWRGIRVPGLRHEGSDAIFIGVRGPGVVATSAYDAEHCATLSQVTATLLTSLGLGDMRTPDMAEPLSVFAEP